jgi:hypothetical protein
MTEAQARAAGLTEEQIAALHLDRGGHEDPQSGHCLLEVVSLFAAEPFGDQPACVDPVLAEFGRVWNDGLPDDERQQLKRYIVLLPNTNKGEVLSLKRSYMALDWAIRVNLPAWLALSPGLAEHAATLRALAPITDETRLSAATSAIDLARAAAAAAWAAAWAAARAAARDAARAAARDAARAAAWAAARDAARDAAWDAARDAAWAAARDAARAAAWDAARAAAWDAAWDAAQAAPAGEDRYAVARAAADAALKGTRDALQAQAHDLYLAMINAELQELGDEARAEAAEGAAP